MSWNRPGSSDYFLSIMPSKSLKCHEVKQIARSASDPEILVQPEPRAGVCNKKIAVQNLYGTLFFPGHFMDTPTLLLTIFSFYVFLMETLVHFIRINP